MVGAAISLLVKSFVKSNVKSNVKSFTRTWKNIKHFYERSRQQSLSDLFYNQIIRQSTCQRNSTNGNKLKGTLESHTENNGRIPKYSTLINKKN